MSAREVSLPDRFQGGRSLMMGGAAGGLVLVIATLAGLAMGEEQARHTMFSYLVAFAYWGGISMASLLLLMIFHAFGAKWMVVLRRPLEAMVKGFGEIEGEGCDRHVEAAPDCMKRSGSRAGGRASSIQREWT